MTLHLGIIEWDGATSPSVVVGGTPESLRRAAAMRLRDSGFENDGDFDEPLADDATDEQVKRWLEDFREACTVPWFTECGDGDADIIAAPDAPIATRIDPSHLPVAA